MPTSSSRPHILAIAALAVIAACSPRIAPVSANPELGHGKEPPPVKMSLEDKPCAADVGTAAAQALVRRCIAVSPATHPPCHVDNPCALITHEIKRSCDMYGPGETKPSACNA